MGCPFTGIPPRRIAPMALSLHPQLSYCLVGGRTVFLDLGADRYFAMPGSVGRSLSSSNPLEADEKEVLGPLFRRGLVVEATNAEPLSPPSICVPDLSILDSLGPFRVRPALSASARLLATVVQVRRLPLVSILDRLRARRQMAGQTPSESTRRVESEEASAFIHSDRFFSRNFRCLASSVALLDQLASRRCFPTLVFGVRVDPFHAHCWVQNAEMVLTDDADRVREFTPILVV